VTAGRRPAYRDLPALGELGIRHARDVLPPDFGTLAFIEPGDVAAAAAGVTTGETVPVNHPVDAFSLFGRASAQHRVVEVDRNELEDVIDAFNPQASSQLDGLAHVRAREFGFFGGGGDIEAARAAIGMHHWARRGIAGRGVLLDLPVPDPFDGSAITPADLLGAADDQGVELRTGDILLVRTRWAAAYLEAYEARSETSWRGLSAGEEMAEFLWDHGIAIIGTDNPAVENSPGSPEAGSLHRRLLPALGMPMMELLDLERLTARCRADGRWSFLFVSVPLNVLGAVSSPANAMALF
jgi:kynurenine formamidase